MYMQYYFRFTPFTNTYINETKDLQMLIIITSNFPAQCVFQLYLVTFMRLELFLRHKRETHSPT